MCLNCYVEKFYKQKSVFTFNNVFLVVCFQEYKVSISVPSLQNTLTQAQTEVELLLCKVDDFVSYSKYNIPHSVRKLKYIAVKVSLCCLQTNYNDMYDMNRSKLEQEIHELQKDMFTVVSDIMDAIKVIIPIFKFFIKDYIQLIKLLLICVILSSQASQDYDNNLLNSYRTKIQSYREKVGWV